MKKKIIAVGLAVLMLLSLSACGECKHETWTPATCSTPATCAECGVTEGEALGHSWQEATCSAPETCYICGETQGELLPHAYGEWEFGESDMSHICTVCGKTDTQALDYEVAVKPLLEGNWSLYYGVIGDTSVDCYSSFPVAFLRMDENGDGILYTPALQDDLSITEILECLLSVANVSYDREYNCYSFYLLAEDGSTSQCQLFIGEDGSLALNLLMDQSTYLILTKNYREEASFAGLWSAIDDGKLYTLELKPDGTLGGDYKGFWVSNAAINSNGNWYSGFSIIFENGDSYTFNDGQIYICSESQDVWQALANGYGTNNITLYSAMGDSWLNFDKIDAERLDELKSAHDEGKDNILGTWTCDMASHYNSSAGQEEKRAGEYSITFNDDGTVTGQLVDSFESTWSYKGAKYNENDINWVYNIMLGDYESSVRILADSSLLFSSVQANDGTYYSYSFTTPEGRAKQAEAEQKAIDLVSGSWSCSSVSVYDSSSPDAQSEEQAGSFTIIINADGTAKVSLLNEYEGIWTYSGSDTYDGYTYHNYYIEHDGTSQYFTVMDDGHLSISESSDNVIWYNYFMSKS